jgi:hypothetical protein
MVGVSWTGHTVDFFNSFRRDDDGAWICTADVTVDHPRGRIQVSAGRRLVPGTLFMDVDLASWLDAEMQAKDGWKQQG